jgi:5-methylcytosine-specific restriction enzyme A
MVVRIAEYKPRKIGRELDRRKVRMYAFGSRDWKILRVKVLERDKFKCAKCGAFADSVDHINENPNDNSLCNLQSLCRSCHGRKTFSNLRGS